MTRPIDRSTVTRCACGASVYMQTYATIRVPINPDGQLHTCPKRPK